MKLGKRWVELIETSDEPDTWIPVVNEIPAGSCCKYRLDKKTGQLSLARALPRDVTFPLNYGFIPHTRSAADDEELDVMIFTVEPLLPLVIVKARLVGGFYETSSDEGQKEGRLLAVLADDPNVDKIEDLRDVDLAVRRKVETFVRTYKQNEDIKVTFDGWFDRDSALGCLKHATKLAKKRAPK